MIFVVLLIVVLVLILISLYAEVKVNSMVNEELGDMERRIDRLEDTTIGSEKQIKSLERKYYTLFGAPADEEDDTDV